MNLPPDLTRKILEMADRDIKPQIGDDHAYMQGKPKRNGKKRRDEDQERLKATKQPKEHRLFDALCVHYGLPIPDHEFPFAEAIGRAWRFDHLFEGWLAVEKEGGVWTNGRHIRGKGFLDDLDKYNHAILLGYSLLRFTPQQFEDGSAFTFIQRVLASAEAQP